MPTNNKIAQTHNLCHANKERSAWDGSTTRNSKPSGFWNYDISNLNMITQNIQQDKNDFIGEVLAQIAQLRSDHLCVSYVVVYKSRRATTQKAASFE